MMSRINPVDPSNPPAEVASLYAGIERSFGAVPAMMQAMANSPALLHGSLEFSSALRGGVIDAATAERIALAVAQSNGCDYCLSAHTFVAEKVAKLDGADIQAARAGHAADPKTAAILALAVAVNEGRGDISDDVVAAARGAGVTDREFVEVIGHVAFNVLTNYFNTAAGTPLDFPVVDALAS
jgi:uncharacterized peroxidase-related enzyme